MSVTVDVNVFVSDAHLVTLMKENTHDRDYRRFSRIEMIRDPFAR